MATTDRLVRASADRCFAVLSDPRSFAYWVVGSREVRSADPEWPKVGSAFDHTVGFGPLRTYDHTEVEHVEPNRTLSLRAKARPFGTARVILHLQPESDGTRVTITEEPLDRLSRLLFPRVAERLLRRRNDAALDRLAELAEGRVQMPDGDLTDRDGVAEARATPPPWDSGTGIGARNWVGEIANGFGRGVAAGLVGGAAMSVSTALDIRVTGRPPSRVPARAIERLLGIRRLRGKSEERVGAVAHVAMSAGIGGLRGSLSAFGLRAPYASPVLFTLALVPDFLVIPALGVADPPSRWSRADLTRSLVHHAVFTGVTASTLAALEK